MKKLLLLAALTLLFTYSYAQETLQSVVGRGRTITDNGLLFLFSPTTTTSNSYMRWTNGGGNTYLGVESAGASTMASGTLPYAFVLSNEHSTALQLATQNNVRLTVAPGGNVGIGTNAPDRKLTVAGDAGLNVRSSTGYYVNINYLYGNSVATLYSLNASGSVANFVINPEGGNVGIGTTTPKEKLSVNGKIRAQEIKVESANWPDYVFEEDYKPVSLQETEQYIKTHKHLPEMPSEVEVKAEGISLGEMNAKLLKKIEELTLHLIEQEKEILKLKNDQRITALEGQINQLTKR